jgi:hypothetical protein
MGNELHEFLRRLEDQLEMTSDESNEQSPLKDPESGFYNASPRFYFGTLNRPEIVCRFTFYQGAERQRLHRKTLWG